MRRCGNGAWLVLAWLAPATVADVRVCGVPSFAFAPATVRIQVRIRPLPSDRCVTIIADGADYYRSTEWTIEGDAAPRLGPPVPFELRDIPAGDYAISAGIGSDAAHHCQRVRAKDEVRLSVIGH